MTEYTMLTKSSLFHSVYTSSSFSIHRSFGMLLYVTSSTTSTSLCLCFQQPDCSCRFEEKAQKPTTSLKYNAGLITLPHVSESCRVTPGRRVPEHSRHLHLCFNFNFCEYWSSPTAECIYWGSHGAYEHIILG